jgi:hypothetical protein
MHAGGIRKAQVSGLFFVPPSLTFPWLALACGCIASTQRSRRLYLIGWQIDKGRQRGELNGDKGGGEIWCPSRPRPPPALLVASVHSSASLLRPRYCTVRAAISSYFHTRCCTNRELCLLHQLATTSFPNARLPRVLRVLC